MHVSDQTKKSGAEPVETIFLQTIHNLLHRASRGENNYHTWTVNAVTCCLLAAVRVHWVL